MARRRAMSEAAIGRRVRAGRGAGERSDYKPWLTVRDVPSLGRRARDLGRHTGRVHHFMSDLEHRVFLEWDMRDDVLDIREQVPLDRERTRRICAALGVRHPRAGNVVVVMTTDLVVDVQTADGFRTVPIACKYAADLAKPRVQQKLRVERRYWELRGWMLQEATEREHPKERGEALQWLHSFHHVDRMPGQGGPGAWLARGRVLIEILRAFPPDTGFSVVARAAEAAGRLAPGEALSLLRYLAAHGRVRIPLHRVFDVAWPISCIELLDR